MPTYVVTPHQGVGPISFGMPRAAVQAAMKRPPETFHKAGAQTLVDTYLDACFQVFYDGAHMVEYIELSRDRSEGRPSSVSADCRRRAVLGRCGTLKKSRIYAAARLHKP